MSNDYDKQAQDFLRKTGSSLHITGLGRGKFWPSDSAPRAIYQYTLIRGEKRHSARFGQSITATKAGTFPSQYEILRCLSGYEPPSDLQEFCLEFGYEIKQLREAQKAFEAVQKEYRALADMYTPEELELLNEID